MKRNFLLMLLLTLLPFVGWAQGLIVPVEVGTVTQLTEAFANGGEVKLTGNIELSEIVKVTNNVILDLNGKKITVSANPGIEEPFIVKRGGTFTVTDKSTDKNGEIDASNCMVGIKMTEAADGDNGSPATLIVKAGTIKGETYGISGNGKRNNTAVTIEGGTVIATSTTDGTGIYNPQAGTLTISGGKIEGYSTAVEVRSGTVNVTVTGGEFIANSNDYTVNSNSNGTTTKGAAFAVAQHTTKQEITVTIKGGTFKGVKALSISNPQNNDATNVAVSVAGGTFDGGIAVAQDLPQTFNTQFIAGGTFNDRSISDYIAPGFTWTESSSEVYEVIPYDWILTESSTSYKADTDQSDIIKQAVKVSPTLSEDEYTVKIYTDENCSTEADEVVDLGTYYVKVFVDDTEIGTKKIFRINKYTVIIITADQTKTYGEEDPLPNFTVAANSEAKFDQGGTEWLLIQGVLKMERYNNETNAEDIKENVLEGGHDYVIKKTAAALAEDFPYNIIVENNTGILHIEKAPLTIKVSPDEKVYNTPDPTYTWVKNPNNDDYNPFKYDDNASNVNITITRAAGEHVGEYAFNAVADNYEVTVVNSFSITTTNSIDGVTATFAETTDDFIYSGTPKEFVPVLSDANGTIPAANVTNPRWSTDRTNVGTVTVTVTLTGDYNSKDFSTTYAITKKELTITAKSYVLAAGASDPTSFEIEYDGWVNDEGTINGPDRTKIPQSAASTTNPVFFKTPSGVKKVNTDAAGVYNLEVIEDAASNNYKFKYQEGQLTFGIAQLKIYANAANKTYGDQDPEFTLSLTVQQENAPEATPTDEKPITIGGVRQINPVRPGAGTDEDAGTYRGAITFDKMPTVLAGYAVQYIKGDFTINKANLTITANNQSKTYGQTDAEAGLKLGYTLEGVTVTGNKNNEATEDILTGTWTYYAPFSFPQQHTNEVIIAVECVSQNNPHSENAGEYTITPRLRGQAGQANEFLKNYNLVFKTGKLTINKAALTIKPVPQTKQFGESDPNFTQLAKVLEVTGLQRNDTKETVLGQIQNLTVKRDRPSTQDEPYKYENVGHYPITAYVPAVPNNLYSGEIANYTWTIQNKEENATIDLVITPVQLIVKALDQSIDYGAEINGYKVKFFKPAVVVADAQPAVAAEVEVEMSEETIKKIINPLTATTTKVGINENGFQWNGFKDGNYAIAKVVVDGVQKDDFRNGYLTIYALQTIPLDEADLAKLDLPAVKVIDEATGKDKDLLKKVLEDHKGKTVNVSLPGRKMDADEWYAYVLPFEVTPRMLSNDNVWGYAAMETLDLNKSSEKSILFELQMFKVPANTPFIVKIDQNLTAAQAKAIVLNNVTIDKEFDYLNETPASEGNGVSFVGQYESTVGFGANQMYLAKVKGYDHREFWRGGEKSASVAFVSTNACLEFTDANAAAGARVYIEEEDGTVTAIGGVESDATVDSEGWYNVSGIKLNAAPAQKGIFIKDGKKVLVK